MTAAFLLAGAGAALFCWASAGAPLLTQILFAAAGAMAGAGIGYAVHWGRGPNDPENRREPTDTRSWLTRRTDSRKPNAGPPPAAPHNAPRTASYHKAPPPADATPPSDREPEHDPGHRPDPGEQRTRKEKKRASRGAERRRQARAGRRRSTGPAPRTP